MSSSDVCKNTFRSSSYPDDLTSQYFRDISSIPLLSSEEEQELTQKLDRLRYAIRDQLLLSYSVKEEYLSVSGGSPEKRGSIIFDSALRNRLIALYIQNAPAEGIKPKEVEKLRSYDRALSEISSRLVESNVRLVISIARRYRVSAANVADWNDVKASAAFKVGEQVVLFVPVRAASPAQARSGKRTASKSAPVRRGGKPSKVKRR